ncbi:hypothetical protein EON66_06745 [archaeon]|nr:MAG: hypothetical protein EON66_06745 [archaeon]
MPCMHTHTNTHARARTSRAHIELPTPSFVHSCPAVDVMLALQVAHATIGYFHHLPFVTSELYRILASRQHLLRGVLGADVLGFHTQDYARHFVSSCVRILGLEATPRGINYASRYVRLVISSIGIDPSPFTTLLRQKSVKKRVAELARQFEGRKVIVSVDAMDAIKGLGCKLVMLEQLLSEHSELRDKVVLIQVTVPAPKALLADTTEKEQSSVMEMVGRINGLYEQVWCPLPPCLLSPCPASLHTLPYVRALLCSYRTARATRAAPCCTSPPNCRVKTWLPCTPLQTCAS